MADPAWGTTSSLSDEETARALCAFHHTESLPTQRHRQPAVPLYQPRSSNHEMQPQRALNARASNGFSAFGYPVHTTHHMVPRSVQRSEATSMLVGIPSTASDDWHRQQQCAIQEQIEQQQRELQAQIHQQQQREMHLQVQRMQVQIQQQEQAQRRQMQVERQAERTQQPRYSSEAGGFEQERWNNEVHTSQAAITASNFHDNRSHDGGMQRQQPGQSYKGRGSSQPGMSTSRSEDIFARLQVPQPAQSHLQTDRTPTFQIQRTQHVLPRQPQPYRPTEVPERIRQAAGPVRSASKSRPDEFVLDGIMKHYQRNVGPPAGAPATSTGAAYDTNSGYSGTRYIKPVFNPSMDQTRIQTQTEIQTQGQLNLHSKVAVPPTGTAVVPGIALASQSIRLLTMRDLLNGDDGSIKMDSARNRGKQKRVPPNRKAPRKKTAVKRQRIPQQQSERRIQPSPINRLVGAIQSRQGASPASIGTSGPVIKLPTPMYIAFMESRAARALEQTIDHANPRPTSAEPQQPTLAPQSGTKSVSQTSDQAVAFTVGGLHPVKKKKMDAPPGLSHPSSTYQQAYHLPVVITSASLQAAAYKEASRYPQPSAAETFQMKSEHHVPVNGQVHGENEIDCSTERLKLSVPNKLVCSVQVGVTESGTAGGSSRKRPRAKLPAAGLKPSTASGSHHQFSTTQVSSEVLFTESGSSATTAVTSSLVVQAPATSAVPRVENRTVVIFCKRDFMRYQAAKIWRKYQEQLKKHEEWREVRVAGKRTRYLNSRYDELQRTHKRTYTRSGKPRRKASQVAKGARRHNASLSSADSAPADFMVSCSMLADNEIDTRKPGQTADGESVDSGASSNDGGAHSPKAKADEADSDCPMVVHDASEAQEKHSSTIEDKTKSAVESSAFNNSSKGVMACSSAHQGHDGTASGSNIADVAPNGDTVAGAPPCGKLEVTSLPDESPDNVDRSVSDATRKSSAEVTEATLGSNTAISGAVAPLNGSADPELVSNCAIEAAISRIDTIAVAAASSNGTVEVIGLAPDTTMSSAVAKAASVETVATSTASRKNMDTDAKASEDTEERSGNDSARICRERNSPSSVENAQPTLQQSTSTIDNYSCADFSAQNGSPLEQQACPASATTIGDGASININLDKPESSDGVARNNEVKPEESLGGIQPSDPDKATDTDPVMITPHGAVTVEAKQHCTESAPLQDVPDMPACNDPSNGDTAV
ncbi:hypothetical protein PI124_g19617 [Phytophthora idaei]|nr:hypothetical protein PI124_g19617 [Phytophthora idaei]